VAEVHIQDGETLENALRRFKRKVLQEDIIKEIKRHSFYLNRARRSVSSQRWHASAIARSVRVTRPSTNQHSSIEDHCCIPRHSSGVETLGEETAGNFRFIGPKEEQPNGRELSRAGSTRTDETSAARHSFYRARSMNRCARVD